MLHHGPPSTVLVSAWCALLWHTLLCQCVRWHTLLTALSAFAQSALAHRQGHAASSAQCVICQVSSAFTGQATSCASMLIVAAYGGLQQPPLAPGQHVLQLQHDLLWRTLIGHSLLWHNLL